MKNYKLLILMILSLNILKSQNHEGIITYKKTFYKSFSELNQNLKRQDPHRYETYNEIWENGKRALENVEFILTYTKYESLFKVRNFVDHEVDELDLNFALGVYGSSTYYKNLMNNVYYRQSDSYGEKFIIEMPDIKWNLTSISKTINGYNCLMAEAITVKLGRKGEIKREVTAWYTNDIPISFGPIGFNGLPGLIIELIYDNEVYTVSKIDFNPNEQILIKKPTKGIKVTKNEFEKIGIDKMKRSRNMF